MLTHVKAATGLDDFRAAPIGRYVAGDGWLYFYPHGRLCGFALWGTPTAANLERLVRALEVELAPGVEPHVSIVDTRAVEGIERGAFDVLGKYVRAHHARLSEVVRALALVRPDGLMGAVAAGFYEMAGAPYPVEVVSDVLSALAWLGRPEDAALLGEIERLAGDAAGTSPFVRALRSLLEARPGRVSLVDAARALAVSPRQLQRQLQEEGATFQGEQNRAQVRVAQAMLLASDVKLSRVAADVGCASLASFSALFRKVTGAPPSAWRDEQRKK